MIRCENYITIRGTCCPVCPELTCDAPNGDVLNIGDTYEMLSDDMVGDLHTLLHAFFCQLSAYLTALFCKPLRATSR